VKIAAVACLLLVILAVAANADIIYFKDGLKTICQEKAWEEDGQVKCEYGGWILNYNKADVLRILKTIPPQPSAPPEQEKNVSVKKTGTVKRTTKKVTPPDVQGLAFYDPRRPYKYWTDKNTKYKSYKEAIQALAHKYEHTPEWIQANMGDTNDLGEIHRNLSAATVGAAANQSGKKSEQPAKKEPDIDFYNPRRPFPYWTGATTKHKSFKEAIQTLAGKYSRSPEWVQQYMGQTNNLSEIHRNLQKRQSAESSK
jgi:hypothetical protein